MHRTESWFLRQIAYARACLAQCEHVCTEQELADARASLAIPPIRRQGELPLDGMRIKSQD